MSSNFSGLPSLQPRHFAFPEHLTSEEREANLRDFEKLQEFYKSKEKCQRSLNEKYDKAKLLEARAYEKAVYPYFINKGSQTARRIYEKITYFETIHDKFFAKENGKIIINDLAELYRDSEHGLQKLDKLEPTKNPYNIVFQIKHDELTKLEKSQLDKEIRICVAAYDVEKKILFLEECIRKYPEEVSFRIFLSHAHSVLKSIKTIEIADAALEKFPGNYLLLKIKATFCHSVKRYKETIDSSLKLLELAPCDYEYLPHMYYLAADSMHQLGSPLSEVEKYFKWGLQAEKERLPFLKLVDCDVKKSLEEMFQRLKPGEALIKAQFELKGNGPKEMYELLGYHRVKLIRAYREEVMKISQGIKMKPRVEPRIRKRKSFSVEKIKFATLYEILERKCGGSNFGLKCFVVEEPIVVRSLVRLVVEDAKGDCVRVFIKNGSKELAEKLIFARKISFLNPYVWRDEDDEKEIEIWIGDEGCVIFEEGDELKRCRFCWKKGELKKCGSCKKCFYCSKECQEMDWIILNHKNVCEN